MRQGRYGSGVGQQPMQDAKPRGDARAQRNILRRAIKLYAAHRVALVTVIILVVLASALGAITPLLIQQLIDDALPNGDTSYLLWLIGGMVGIAAVVGGLNLAQSQLNASVGFKVMEQMRHAVYQNLLQQPLSFFSSTKTGDMQSRLANDVSSTQLVLTDTVVNILSSVTVVIAALVAMLVLSWELTIVAVITMPLFAYLSKIVGERRRRLTAQTQRALADLTSKTGETLFVSGVIVAKTFGREEQQLQEFQETNASLTKLSIKQYMTGRGFFVVVQAFFTMAPAFIWLVGGLFIINETDRISLGDIVAFTTIQARLLFPMANLLQRGVEISGSIALFERIFQYMDLRPTITDPVNPVYVDPKRARGEVAFDNVSFRYQPSEFDDATDTGPASDGAARSSGSGLRQAGGPPRSIDAAAVQSSADAATEDLFALGGISFTANAGALTALVGPSGSGKTTIGYLAARLYDADTGSVKIDGVNVKDISHDNLTKLVGVVSQTGFLFHASVRANLLYGRPDAQHDEIVEAAKAAQIHDTIAALPDGYETVVGEHGYKLSGGERQRLAIARVILADPKVLLLDEATSSLDSLSEHLIQEALTRLREGRTTIAIAHRLSTIIEAEQIVVVHRGKIVDIGRHDDLLQESELYSALYQQQFQHPGNGANPHTGTHGRFAGPSSFGAVAS